MRTITLKFTAGLSASANNLGVGNGANGLGPATPHSPVRLTLSGTTVCEVWGVYQDSGHSVNDFVAMMRVTGDVFDWGTADLDHDGSSGVDDFIDSTEAFGLNELVGLTITNDRSAASGTITSNTTGGTIVAELTGGSDQVWNNGDGATLSGTNFTRFPLTSIQIFDSTNTTLHVELTQTTSDERQTVIPVHVIGEDMVTFAFQDIFDTVADLVNGTTYVLRITGEFDEYESADDIIPDWDATTVYGATNMFTGKLTNAGTKSYHATATVSLESNFEDFITTNAANVTEIGPFGSFLFSIDTEGVEDIQSNDLSLVNGWPLINPAGGGGGAGLTFDLTYDLTG